MLRNLSENVRKGLTLTELLVTTAIGAVLLGLTLAAVQKVRVSAANADVENRMRQIGLLAQQQADSVGGKYQANPYGGIISPHDIYSAYLQNRPASDLLPGLTYPNGSLYHYPAARGGNAFSTEYYYSSIFIDPTVAQQTDQATFGFYQPAGANFSPVTDAPDGRGTSQLPFVFQRKVDSVISPDDPKSMPLYDKSDPANAVTNWVDAVATPGGTNAGIRFKDGVSRVLFRDGHVERLTEEQARGIDR